MSSISKRLDALEAQAQSGGFLAVYADPDHEGVFCQNSPFSADPGREYTRAELDALNLGTLIVFHFAKDWRNENADPDKTD